MAFQIYKRIFRGTGLLSTNGIKIVWVAMAMDKGHFCAYTWLIYDCLLLSDVDVALEIYIDNHNKR